MVYNLTSVANSTNPALLVSGVNDITGGLFMPLILVAFFIVMVMVLLRVTPPAEAFFSASVVGLVVSLTLVAVELVQTSFIVGFTAIAVLSGIALYLNR